MEIAVDDAEEDTNIMDDFDLFVFVEESDEERLSDFIASGELFEKLVMEGVPDDDDNNLDAR